MKKIVLAILITGIGFQSLSETLYDQLCTFNYNWQKYADKVENKGAIHFNSDQEYVATHLLHVIPILKANSTDHLTAQQQETRAQLIKILDRYRLRGKFPINYYKKERIPVFIDEHNTHCAVGYLLKETGFGHVARRISTKNNYAWVKEIDDPALPEWQAFSGFSLEELKLIQGAYDFYMPGAFTAPNKYEIPQEPKCVTAKFDNVNQPSPQDKLWCYGEGENDILHGRWEQNYSAELPWIVGFFNRGKRTGQWKEYYKGTRKLCRTENWRNDKLNGIRKRFDREGRLIEEILFKDGEAVTKINYDLRGGLRWVRQPLDSNLVWTEVYTLGGALLANGNELIDNPDNLLWFQNIELTALNTFSISSRDMGSRAISASDIFSNGSSSRSIFNPQSQQSSGRGFFGGGPSLVKYKKQGNWVYYHEFIEAPKTTENPTNSTHLMLNKNYHHFGEELYSYIARFEELSVTTAYDSILVKFEDNMIQDFFGFGEDEYTHLQFSYHKPEEHQNLALHNYNFNPHGQFQRYEPKPTLASIGQMNEVGDKIGVWKHYNYRSQLYKVETFMIPWREENDEQITVSQR